MNQPLPTNVTTLLNELRSGNPRAASELIPLVYKELHRLASRYMRRERANHTLQATVLVHDAYLKLVEKRSINWRNRAHFFGVASQVMRHLLIDYARAHLRGKRNGGQEAVPLDEALVFTRERSAQLLDLHEALKQLARLDPRQERIVELRFFGGLSVEEAAEVLGISPITVKRDWVVAKSWLYRRLRGNRGDHAGTVANG
jgi:RNA polymerase sigma-70 factor (ECF subfamily)